MPTQLLAVAVESWQRGDPLRAEELCKAVIARDPARADAHRLLVEIHSAAGRNSEAIAACQRVAELAPQDAPNWRRLAVLLSQNRTPQAAISALETSLKIEPDNARALNNLGNLLTETGRANDAIPVLERALAVQPNYPVALNNLGNALTSVGRSDEAIERYQSALALNARFLEVLMNLGRTLHAAKRFAEALDVFDRAVVIDPKLARAHSGRAQALAMLGQGREAITTYRQALLLNPRDFAAFVQMGHVMLSLGYFGNADSAFTAALELVPGDLAAEEGRVMALLALNRHEEAIPAIAALRRAAPWNEYLQGHQLHAQLQCADWSEFDFESRDIAERVRRGERVDLPLSFIAHNESPADQLLCARTFILDRWPHDTPALARAARSPNARLRIAYLSPDFRDHPVAKLIAGVIESHDRSRFETYAFSMGHDDGSEIRRRLESAFEHFQDVVDVSDSAVAERMADLAIDIAIDLGGHTQGSRTQILARRPAPVQVGFLGFPGTLGADFIDYIVADRHVIPGSHRAHYAEQVIYLPNSYLPGALPPPCDISPTRMGTGLPERGIVFCCFNAPHKILPPVFDAWMRILKAVPESVAWLRDTSPTVKTNLGREAEGRGIDPARLVFAPKTITNAEHCARLALADLFLDTRPYNAHTTASDALGAGVPVITMRGNAFAGRVAMSLLHACGLGHLSVDTLEQYEQLAIELARSPSDLANLKDQLLRTRATVPLFDTTLFCRHLEAAYVEIWARHERGEKPSTLWIPEDV